jgi:type VI secretion system secreted protein VgrG
VTNMVEPDDAKTEHLRVRVKFNWGDGETSLESAWVRVAQPWAGNGHGAQFIPHVGDEVVVEFLNGDPNFPIVTGSVYNGTYKAFYPTVTDGQYTVTAIKTLSNELKIDDVADAELVQITGKKTFQVIAGAEKAELKADDTQILVQHKAKPISVLADQGDITVKATSGNITIEAGTSITLKVGQCKIEITTSGITVKGTQVSINSDGGTEVKSSAITTVKGSLVQIN